MFLIFIYYICLIKGDFLRQGERVEKMRLIILILLTFVFSFKINHHVHKSKYREVHPLFDKKELPKTTTLSRKGVGHHNNRDFTIVSLHDDKYYDNVTWIVLINPIQNKCKNNSIDIIKYNIEKDGCILYTSLFLTKNILIKMGCPVVYSNVFLKPKNTTEYFHGCQKVVKVRKNHYYNDLRDLIKTPLFNNTLSLLNDCYGKDNVIIEKNFLYHKPYSNEGMKNLLNNYYKTHGQYKKIKNYPPSEQWKSMYSTKSVQINAPWHLDRIDQRFGLDGAYNYNNGCSDITALIIDTGILATHVEFGGRAEAVIDTSGDNVNTDNNGHGVCNYYCFFLLILSRHM